jgi:hypothetical protein
MVTPKTKTRITFDFTFENKGERRKSYDKLAQIICASRWGSGIDILGIMDERHRRLFDFIDKRATENKRTAKSPMKQGMGRI